jgi:hypothetical protein
VKTTKARRHEGARRKSRLGKNLKNYKVPRDGGEQEESKSKNKIEQEARKKIENGAG